MSPNLLHWLLLVTGTYVVVNALYTIALVGKPREPYTGGSVAFSVAVLGAMAFVVFVAAARL